MSGTIYCFEMKGEKAGDLCFGFAQIEYFRL